MWWCKFTAFLFAEKANKLCSFHLLLQILRLPADTDLYVFYGKWQKKRRNASVSYKFWSFLDFQLLSFGRFSNIFLDIHYQTLTYVQRDGRTNGERESESNIVAFVMNIFHKTTEGQLNSQMERQTDTQKSVSQIWPHHSAQDCATSFRDAVKVLVASS